MAHVPQLVVGTASLDLLQSLSNGAQGYSNPAKLALLEMRMAGADVVGARQIGRGSSEVGVGLGFAPPGTAPDSVVQPSAQADQPQAKRRRAGSSEGSASPTAAAAAAAPSPAAAAGQAAPGHYALREPLSDLQLQAFQQQHPQQAVLQHAASTQPLQRAGSAQLADNQGVGNARKSRKDPCPQKRKRNSSPVDQQAPHALHHLASPVAAGVDGLITPGPGPAPGLPASTTRALFTNGPSAPHSMPAAAATATPASNSRARANGPKTGAKAGTQGTGTKGGGGQTKLNAFYPVVDSNSRDSEVSGGHSAGQGHAAAHLAAGHHAGTSGAAARQLPTTNSSPFQPAPRPGGSVQGPPTHSPATAAGPGAGGSGVRVGGPSPYKKAAAGAAAGPACGAAQHSMGAGGLVPIPEGTALECGAAGQQVDVHALIAQATSQLQAQLAAKDSQLAELQQQQRQLQAAADKRVADLAAELSAVQARAVALQTALDRARQVHDERDAKLRSELTRALCVGASDRRELLKLQLASASLQLGSVGVHRAGISLQEVWEDGPALTALAAKQAVLAAQREEVEAARKALRKKLAPPPSAARLAAAAAGTPMPPPAGAPEGGYMDGLEFVTTDEIYKTRLAGLKREEEGVKAEQERLAGERNRHLRALKRLRDEEGSRFGCGTTVLGGRFVLLSMLGKGGFSEVFKAYDLRDLRVVAAKVHQLSPAWSEARKASYVKHAIREVDIQKALRHPHIVSLVDILEVDAHCFATVLEFCDGGDLDALLRDHNVLPEKEARSLLCQVMAGLAYLNQPGRRVIHYDLKPANILFDALGAAKITDFGLSKVVEEGATQGLELTSQGAGTYWYLPPECFEVGGPHAPRITNKVDVWSVGVIFYQMLYGRRPYGEGLSQEQIMRDRVVLGAREVEFPSKPSVSAEAKEFIRRCLALRAEQRWDVAAAAADPYISKR